MARLKNTLAIAGMAMLFAGPASRAALIAHYDFDGASSDLAGGDNDATLINGASYSGDVPAHIGAGQSLALANGGGTENQGARVVATGGLGEAQFTLAYWIKPTAFQGNAGLERLTSRGGDNFETAIGDRNAVGITDPLTLSYFQGAVGWVSTETQIPFSQWTHVAWRNGGTGANDLSLAINGQTVFTGAGIAAIAGDPTLTIGTRHNDVEGFEGLLDDFRYYDNVLTDGELAGLIPEPSVPVLFLGAAGFLVARRRRRG